MKNTNGIHQAIQDILGIMEEGLYHILNQLNELRMEESLFS